MKTVYTLEDHVRYNHKDTQNIARRSRKNLERDHDIDDVTQSIYLKFSRSDTVEKWDASKGASYSTYIYRCIFNHTCAYFGRLSKRDSILKYATCIDEPMFDDNDRTLAEILESPSDTPDLRMALELVYKELLASKDKRGVSVVPLDELFEAYALGYTDKDIAFLTDCTTSNVGSRNRILRKFIRRVLNVEESRSNCEEFNCWSNQGYGYGEGSVVHT